jgi:hypothetical protein
MGFPKFRDRQVKPFVAIDLERKCHRLMDRLVALEAKLYYLKRIEEIR